MLKLCNFYIVVVNLLLLFQIAHTFVLLTANVEDVKKIARKFVSDELAEKIADFIARATETFSHQVPKASEENVKDNSQVSAENRMYNIERHGNFDGSSKLKLKNKVKATEKNDPSDAKDEDSKPKLRKETKGKSRYIIESNPSITSTKKAGPKDNGEDNYDKLTESIKMIENNLLDADNKDKTKKSKKKAKVKPYKLLSTYNSDEVNVKDGATGTKEKKEKIPSKEKKEDKLSKRSYDDEIAAIRNAALVYEDDANQKTTKALLVKDESDKYDDEITKKSEKAANTNSLVTEKDNREGKWWEKDLPKQHQDADANSKHKTWF